MMHTISSHCFLFLHLSLYLHCKTMKAWNCSLAWGPWFEPLHHLLLPTMIICSKTGSCSLLKDVLVFLKFSQRRAQKILSLKVSRKAYQFMSYIFAEFTEIWFDSHSQDVKNNVFSLLFALFVCLWQGGEDKNV